MDAVLLCLKATSPQEQAVKKARLLPQPFLKNTVYRVVVIYLYPRNPGTGKQEPWVPPKQSLDVTCWVMGLGTRSLAVS